MGSQSWCGRPRPRACSSVQVSVLTIYTYAPGWLWVGAGRSSTSSLPKFKSEDGQLPAGRGLARSTQKLRIPGPSRASKTCIIETIAPSYILVPNMHRFTGTRVVGLFALLGALAWSRGRTEAWAAEDRLKALTPGGAERQLASDPRVSQAVRARF